MRLYILLTVFVLYNGCIRPHTPSKEDANMANAVGLQSERQEESIVILQPLNKYVTDFIEQVDSIPNPHNRSIVYTVSFLKQDNDTIIEIAGSLSARLVKEEAKSEYSFKGGGYINEKPVLIYDYTVGIGISCYNQSDLNQELANRFIYNDSLDLTTSWTYVPPTMRLRLLQSQTIELLEDNTGSGKYNFH